MIGKVFNCECTELVQAETDGELVEIRARPASSSRSAILPLVRRMLPGIGLAAALAAVPAPAATLVRAPPALRVAAAAPFTVHGVRFDARERVTVVAIVRGRHVRRATATSAGSFTVRFAGVSLDRCQAYLVTATGNRGSNAALKVRPQCPPL